jgi:hypothetical protein
MFEDLSWAMSEKAMSQAVREILERIDHLPEHERQELDELLARRAETEWKRAADEARRVARENGIDQAAIDDAVDWVRRGSVVGA